LIEIKQKPFLAYLLDNLKKAGYEEFILVVGFRADLMQEFLKEYGYKATVVNQFDILGPKEKEYGTLCPLKCVKDLIGDESFLAVYGDNLYSVKDLASLREGNGFNYIAALEHENPEKYGVLLTDNGFLKEIGDGFMQFIPLVERVPAQKDSVRDYQYDERLRASEYSVRPGKFADFYITIFDEWIRNDVGRQFVQLFDATLGNWLGAEPGVCYYSRTCGHAAALEHNGDLYSCDHYVYPLYRLGNIMESPLGDLLNSEEQRVFGMDKYEALPRLCKECEWLFVCHGECPKNRIVKTSDGEPGLNYLCRGYRRIFKHMAPYMEIMSGLVCSGRQPAEVMNIIEGRGASL